MESNNKVAQIAEELIYNSRFNKKEFKEFYNYGISSNGSNFGEQLINYSIRIIIENIKKGKDYSEKKKILIDKLKSFSMLLDYLVDYQYVLALQTLKDNLNQVEDLTYKVFDCGQFKNCLKAEILYEMAQKLSESPRFNFNKRLNVINILTDKCIVCE